jgi:hypothetical protein
MELYAISIIAVVIVLLYIVLQVYHTEDRKKKVSRVMEDTEWFSLKVLCISAFVYALSFVLDTNKCHVASVFRRTRHTPETALSIALSIPKWLMYNILCKSPWIVPSPVVVRAVPWFTGAMLLPVHAMFALAKYVVPPSWTTTKNIKLIIAALQIGLVAVLSTVLGIIDRSYATANIRWLTIGHDSWTTFEVFRKFLVLAAGVTAAFTLAYYYSSPPIPGKDDASNMMVSTLRNAMTIAVVTGVAFGLAFSFFN